MVNRRMRFALGLIALDLLAHPLVAVRQSLERPPWKADETAGVWVLKGGGRACSIASCVAWPAWHLGAWLALPSLRTLNQAPGPASVAMAGPKAGGDRKVPSLHCRGIIASPQAQVMCLRES